MTKRCRILDQTYEYIYLIAFFLLVVFAFLKTTLFPVPWALQGSAVEYFYEYNLSMPAGMVYVLAGLILIRCVMMGRCGWKHLVMSAVILGLTAQAVRVNQCENLLVWALLILGAKNVSFEKIMAVYTLTIGTMLSITVLSATMGWIDNIAYGESQRLAFGIVSPTDFGAHVFFFFLCLWYVRKEKAGRWFTLLTAGIGVLMYYYSETRCSSICMILLSVLICVHDMAYRRGVKRKKTYDMPNVLAVVLAVSIQLAALATLCLTMLYRWDYERIVKWDSIMSNRLELGKRVIDISGFHLWGKNFRMIGHWAEGTVTGNYFYLDSSYLQMIVMYGLIITVLLMAAFLVIGYRAYSSRLWILLWVLGLLAIHGIIEQRLWSLSYCPFLLAVFARLDERKKGGRRR